MRSENPGRFGRRPWKVKKAPTVSGGAFG